MAGDERPANRIKDRTISESEGSNLREIGSSACGGTVPNFRPGHQGRRPSTAGGRFQLSTDFHSYSTVMSPASTFPVMSHSTLPSMNSSEFPSLFSLPISRTDPSADLCSHERDSGRRLDRHLTLSAPLLAVHPSKRRHQTHPCFWRGPINE